MAEVAGASKAGVAQLGEWFLGTDKGTYRGH